MLIEKVTEEYLQYLKSIKRYSENTVKSYHSDLEGFNSYCNEYYNKEISGISEKFIKSYLMVLSEIGIERKSIARKLSALKGLFKFAFQNEYIEIDRCSTIVGPKFSRKLPEIISVSSILEAYKEIDRNKNSKMIKTIFEILYGCAIRVDELCKLNYGDLNLKEKTLRVFGKGSKTRIVPVGEKSIVVIKEYLDTKKFESIYNPLFVTKHSKRIYRQLVYKLVNKYLSLVTDLKKKSPHILRHSAATHMLDNGADLKAVKEILGHENLSTTQIYTHVSVERLKSAYKKSHPKS
ncbi:MAG: hypothetical protein A2V93_09090 [Ignavibacteria bacterium RBG_16_34_14]|nr:MAG: hypothetical protein A2V93_09090 [Ignavibacteria bacterium RBG_16_34_14]